MNWFCSHRPREQNPTSPQFNSVVSWLNWHYSSCEKTSGPTRIYVVSGRVYPCTYSIQWSSWNMKQILCSLSLGVGDAISVGDLWHRERGLWWVFLSKGDVVGEILQHKLLKEAPHRLASFAYFRIFLEKESDMWKFALLFLSSTNSHQKMTKPPAPTIAKDTQSKWFLR